ncbi:DUF2207 domain-containing protein [Gulosibacter chungangensis]|uniref:DUF2207 domain-containing protein n=1 Tax=Gulosibacter chungangensis TaxID=979746 RepID=A0A7J5BBA0_9MICO|nr:DUF2207 domain-containing protein [Gulosibacter chungangensis]KAB1643374.1 DUF2207 domain-containing protein [Gulosibacter chungangensis]
MMELSRLFGFVAIGVVLVLIALLIVVMTGPFVKHLPRSQVVHYVPPAGSVIHHGLAVRADRRVLAAAIIELVVTRKVRLLTMPGARGPIALEVRPNVELTPDDLRFLQALRPALIGRRRRRYLEALKEIGIHVQVPEKAPDIYFLKGRGAFRLQQRTGLSNYFDAVRRELVSGGLTHKRPVSVHLYLLSLLFLAVCIIGFLLVIGAIVQGEWSGAIVIVLVAVALFGVLMIAPPPLLRFTPLGRELRRYLSGLRDYVRLAEQDRLRVLQSPQGALRLPAGALTPGGKALGLRPAPITDDVVAQTELDRYLLIEKLLPYAVLFRCEKQWQREFQQLGSADVSVQNLHALESTLNGVAAVFQAISIVLQIARFIGSVLSLFARG